MHLSIKKWGLAVVLQHKLGSRVVWELDTEFQFFAPSQHLYVMPGKTFRTRPQKEKKGKLKQDSCRIQDLNLFCLIPGVPQSCYAFQFLICLRHTPIYFESGPTLNKAEQYGVCPTIRPSREEAVFVPGPGGVVRQELSAHAEGRLTRLGSLQNPAVLYRNINPAGGYLDAAIEKEIRAGSSWEEWLELKFSQAGETSGTSAWFRFLTVRRL